jgi:hypothetical protein
MLVCRRWDMVPSVLGPDIGIPGEKSAPDD